MNELLLVEVIATVLFTLPSIEDARSLTKPLIERKVLPVITFFHFSTSFTVEYLKTAQSSTFPIGLDNYFNSSATAWLATLH